MYIFYLRAGVGGGTWRYNFGGLGWMEVNFG